MSDKQEVAKRTPTEIAAQKALLETGFTGYEGMTSDMLNVPFLKIAQTNTLAIDDREDPSEKLEAGRIAGLKPGVFYNTQAGKKYGKELRVIALFAKSSYLYYGKGLGNFKGEFSEAQIEAMVKKGVLIPNESAPGWHDKDAADPADAGKAFFAITFYCFLPDFPEDGILPFVTKSKMLKHAKNWNSLSNGMTIKVGKEIRKAARFQLVWKLKSMPDDNEKGKWNNIGNDKASGIEHVGNIFQPEFSACLPALHDAVMLIETMKDKQLNYGAEVADEGGASSSNSDDDVNQFED